MDKDAALKALIEWNDQGFPKEERDRIMRALFPEYFMTEEQWANRNKRTWLAFIRGWFK